MLYLPSRGPMGMTFATLFLLVGCQNTPPVALESIVLPAGFEISVFAEVPNARSLAISPEGTVFAGTRPDGKVYAVRDEDGDGRAERTYVIAQDLTLPNGVAFRDGDLYVAEVNRIWRFPSIEGNLSSPPSPILVSDRFPDDKWHGWKYIAFGPDDKLYVPIGAPGNVCDCGDPYATITRMNPDGSEFEIIARGVRNTVGFDWHPTTAELWFTDNGRDLMGDDIPPDELNRAPRMGMHFGFPFLHGADIPDPEFQDPGELEYTKPVQELGPHVAALGMEFYTGEQFPQEYHNQIFIAEHGSWNRSKKIGYRVSLVRLGAEGDPVSYETFAEGWLQDEENWGRPVDIELLPDGSMLVSDDFAGLIYRISYTGVTGE